MMAEAVRIRHRTIGDEAPVFIIAEIGNTHDGSLGQAKALMAAAAAAGADAVKLQTHDGEAETLPDAPFPPYFQPGETRIGYYTRSAFTEAQYRELIREADRLGVILLSSPFSIKAVELLERVGMSAYKIPSGEVTNLPFVEAIAKLRKPISLSSGMSNWGELDQAVETIRRYHSELVCLQCTSAYPCGYERVGFNVLPQMRVRYGVPVGLSDHTETGYTALAGVALGARVIEKHFTLSKQMFGPDAKFSMEPAAFRDMVQGIRAIETALTHPVNKDDLEPFREMKRVFEKSIVAARDLAAGTVLTAQDLTCKKPQGGLSPSRFYELMGRTLRRPLQHNERIRSEDCA